jgi:hypothetical protein
MSRTTRSQSAPGTSIRPMIGDLPLARFIDLNAGL